jgi:RNA polymerase sigma-54 factor
VTAMRQGLSLGVSQHLTLTPQLQQSIRLLQLSTMELAQEIDQMLQDNPFLEQDSAEQSYEEVLQAERLAAERLSAPAEAAESSEWDYAQHTPEAATERTSDTSNDSEPSLDGATEASITDDWEGEGSHEVAADDAEWGNDAPARNNNSHDGDDVEASSMSAEHLTLQDFLHRQALGLRLQDEDRGALMFLIESLNDDGYLEDDFESLAESLGATTLEDIEELVQRFSMALKLLHHMQPEGVGARNLAECLTLQLRVLPQRTPAVNAALAVCAQPMDLLARRDVKRLTTVCALSAELVKEAIAVIIKLDPTSLRPM